jgi:environmental stress-induced protein Ves
MVARAGRARKARSLPFRYGTAMPITLIRPDDHQLVPWKNGKGMTREVANAMRPDGTMLWRLSLATVDRDGPFSDFTGYKRIIMLLEGKGMTLDFGPHGSAVMDRPFVPVTFDGGWPTSATLVDGPTRDFIVVTAHDGAASAVEVLKLTAAGEALAPSHSLTVLLALAGAATVETADGRQRLETGDCLRLDGAGQGGRIAAERDSALVYRIDIDLA